MTIKAVRAQLLLGDIPLNVYQLPDGRYKLAGRNVTDAAGEAANSAITKKRYFSVYAIIKRSGSVDSRS